MKTIDEFRDAIESLEHVDSDAFADRERVGYRFSVRNPDGRFLVFSEGKGGVSEALMFLGAGAVMHALDNETDMRNMGGLRSKMPVVGWTFMAGWLAICGLIPR